MDEECKDVRKDKIKEGERDGCEKVTGERRDRKNECQKGEKDG